ncbi:MAG TPA: carboxymuconolactone decarboxylase family protein [Gammaproteobacteria bacterium]|nr:carboxymuconolactone decarboxylase family protein [Gammaproteobacteria bacterium]
MSRAKLLATLAASLLLHEASAAPRIAPVTEAQRTDAQRALAERFAPSGMTNAVATFLQHPALAEAILPYERYISADSKLPPRHRGLLHLRTAWLTRSEYMWAHHAQRALRAGVTRAELARVAAGPTAEGWSAFEAALLRAADELHVDSFVSDATWAALAAEYDTNQMIDLIYGVGEMTMLAGAINTLGVALEGDVAERFPAGIPYTVAAAWKNERLVGKAPRIAPLQPNEWTPVQRARLDPQNTGRAANVFATFARDPPTDALRNAVSGHIRGGSTLTPRHRETVIMRIGVLCRSEYEWAAHMRAGKGVGMTDADVERIARGPDAPGDAFEAALLRATDELYRDDRVSEQTWAVLAAQLDTKQLLDVLIAVGGYRTASMTINSAGVQLDANMADFRFPAFLR